MPHTETTTTKNKIIDFVPRAAHSLFPGEERPAEDTEAKTGKPGFCFRSSFPRVPRAILALGVAGEAGVIFIDNAIDKEAA